MKKLSLIALLGLSACTPPTVEAYRPVVDRPGKHYAADLAECQQIGTTAQAAYTQRQNEQMMTGLLVGALLGAAVGGSYGGNYAGAGAAYGAAAGIAGTDTDLAAYGPRRIIDRCLAGRGYRVLSDLGQG